MRHLICAIGLFPWPASSWSVPALHSCALQRLSSLRHRPAFELALHSCTLHSVARSSVRGRPAFALAASEADNEAEEDEEVDADDDFAFRFRGVRMLYGENALERFRNAHVAIIGLGGIGGWAAEGIARTGFGTITLADMDDCCISNSNRQVHSLASTVGQAKVDVLKERIALINPECTVHTTLDWVVPENAAAFARRGPPPIDVIIEAVGLPQDKAGIIAACVREGVRVVSTGSTAARRDLTSVKRMDLAAAARSDSLLRDVVQMLTAAEYGWPALGEGEGYGLSVVSSVEPPQRCDSADPADSFRGDSQGTCCAVTAGIGLAAASLATEMVAGDAEGNDAHLAQLLALRERLRTAPGGAGAGAAPSGQSS